MVTAFIEASVIKDVRVGHKSYNSKNSYNISMLNKKYVNRISVISEYLHVKPDVYIRFLSKQGLTV